MKKVLLLLVIVISIVLTACQTTPPSGFDGASLKNHSQEYYNNIHNINNK